MRALVFAGGNSQRRNLKTALANSGVFVALSKIAMTASVAVGLANQDRLVAQPSEIGNAWDIDYPVATG
jgi:hypothetical protein